MKQRKQELLALWIIFRLGRLRRQQGIEAAACKAARIAGDRLTRHLKTPSNDGCADPPQAAQNGQSFLAIRNRPPLISPTRFDAGPLGKSLSITRSGASLCSTSIIQAAAV